MTTARVALLFACGLVGLAAGTHQDAWQCDAGHADRKTSYLWKIHNEWRKANGADNPAAKWSTSLFRTAFYHTQDIAQLGYYDTACTNTFSLVQNWHDQRSTVVDYDACCMATSAGDNFNCMWDKPGQIAGYAGSGSEVIFYDQDSIMFLSEIEDHYNIMTVNSSSMLLGIDGYGNMTGMAVINGYDSSSTLRGAMAIWTSTTDETSPCLEAIGEAARCVDTHGKDVSVSSYMLYGHIDYVGRTEAQKTGYSLSHQLTATSAYHAQDMVNNPTVPAAWSNKWPTSLPEGNRWRPCATGDECASPGVAVDQAFRLTGYWEAAYEVPSVTENNEPGSELRTVVRKMLEMTEPGSAQRDLLLNTGAWDGYNFTYMGVGWEDQFVSIHVSEMADSTSCTIASQKDIACPLAALPKDPSALETAFLDELNKRRGTKTPFAQVTKLRRTAAAHTADLVKANPSTSCSAKSWSTDWAAVVPAQLKWFACACYTDASAADKADCDAHQAKAITAFYPPVEELPYKHSKNIDAAAVESIVTEILKDQDANEALLNDTYTVAGISVLEDFVSIFLGEKENTSLHPWTDVECPEDSGGSTTTTTTSSTTTKGSGGTPEQTPVCYNTTGIRTKIPSLDKYVFDEINKIRKAQGGPNNKAALTWAQGLRQASYWHVYDMESGGVNNTDCGARSWSKNVATDVRNAEMTWNTCECWNRDTSNDRNDTCTEEQPDQIGNYGIEASQLTEELAVITTSKLSSKSAIDRLLDDLLTVDKYAQIIKGTGYLEDRTFRDGACAIRNTYLSCFISEAKLTNWGSCPYSFSGGVRPSPSWTMLGVAAVLAAWVSV